jgi:hypothetical protein
MRKTFMRICAMARPAIPAFRRSLEVLKGWLDGPPVIEPPDVVGSSHLFGARREEAAGREGGRSGHGPRAGPARPGGAAGGAIRPA